MSPEALAHGAASNGGHDAPAVEEMEPVKYLVLNTSTVRRGPNADSEKLGEFKAKQMIECVEKTTNAAGLEVLYDDRPERPGFKFKDAELIGLPWRVGLGKRGIDSGSAELVERRSGERFDVPLAELAEFLTKRIVPARLGN